MSDIAALVDEMLAGNRRALARLITYADDGGPALADIMNAIPLPHRQRPRHRHHGPARCGQEHARLGSGHRVRAHAAGVSASSPSIRPVRCPAARCWAIAFACP